MSSFDFGQQSNIQYGHVTYVATSTNTNVNSVAIDTAGYAGAAIGRSAADASRAGHVQGRNDLRRAHVDGRGGRQSQV